MVGAAEPVTQIQSLQSRDSRRLLLSVHLPFCYLLFPIHVSSSLEGVFEAGSGAAVLYAGKGNRNIDPQFSSGCSHPLVLTSRLPVCETGWPCGYQYGSSQLACFSHIHTNLLDCLLNKSRGERKRVIGMCFK